MTRSRHPFRRLALAIATAQLLAYAIAPALEAANDRAPGPTHVERAHTETCPQLHAPDACLACQLLSLHARTSDAGRIEIIALEVFVSDVPANTGMASRPPPNGRRTRAPPSSLA